MKFKEIQYSEIKSNIYDRFIDMLVKNTSFSDDVDFNDNQNVYVTYIKFPFYDDGYELKFKHSESWSMNVPPRYHLENMLMVVGVDSNEDPKIAEAIFLEYIDRFGIKVKDFIKQFMEYEG
jgi:hypothetical protein